MCLLLKFKFIFLITTSAVITLTCANYWKDREDFIKREESVMLGSSIILNEKEQKVNQILMRYKYEEYDAGFGSPGIFAPGRHFFNAREAIEKSKVFQFIKKVPKGGALHGHDTALASFEYLYSLTHKDNLYACDPIENGRIKLMFLANPEQDKSCKWKLIRDFRKEDSKFDEFLRSQLTLDVTDPRKTYPHINVVWKALNDIFASVDRLLNYRPVFEEYLYQALLELYADNVMYLEFRGVLPAMYDLNGTHYGPMEVAGFYKEVVSQFKKDFPKFIDARFIYAPGRNVDNTTIENYIKIVKDLKKSYPDFLAGFDLVGQEDLGFPLTEFVQHLHEIPEDIDFIFHAAETNWYGTSTDMNIVDAVLLGTRRIGHGYGLVKHPLVMKMVKEKGIGIEVCPISNQVLMLVEDMRNHPAAILISQGYPVIISYDDPSFWSTKGLSYDFYMAFMGIASRNADLRLLKQLAKNSLTYSILQAEEKAKALERWEADWKQFVDNIIEESDSNKVGYNRYNIIILIIGLIGVI